MPYIILFILCGHHVLHLLNNYIPTFDLLAISANYLVCVYYFSNLISSILVVIISIALARQIAYIDL